MAAEILENMQFTCVCVCGYGTVWSKMTKSVNGTEGVLPPYLRRIPNDEAVGG